MTAFKTCTKCQKEFPHTKVYFYVRKERKNSLRRECKKCIKLKSLIHYNKNDRKPPKKNTNIKECNSCNLKLNIHNFRLRTRKTLNGGKRIFYLNVCKKCEKQRNNETLKLRKLAKEQGRELEHKKEMKEIRLNSVTEHPELLFIYQSLRKEIRRKIKKGYKFTTIEQYKLDLLKEKSLRFRKYNYKDVDFVSRKLRDSRRIETLTDGYILNAMRLKKSDNVPPEVIELKRLNIQIKRLIK